MADVVEYDPATALDAFYSDRTQRNIARLWAVETEIAKLAQLGILQYFAGSATNPTSLTGYASDKLWLRTSAGVTDEPGEVLRWSGVNPASNPDNWVALDREGFLAHLGESSDDAADVITIDTTLNVPSQYATIAAALAYLAPRSFSAGVTITIQVADGTYTNNGLEFTHPQGNQIQLIGDTTTPGNCILRSTSGVNAIHCRNGNNLKLIDGFRIENTGTKGGHGILVELGSFIGVGNVEVDNFYYGVAAKNGGSINGNGTGSSSRIEVTDAGDVGIWAFVGGSIRCQYAVVDGSVDLVNNLGFGIMAEYGSSIDCQYAETMNNNRSGVASFSGSAVRAYNVNSHDNTTHGFECLYSSSMTCHSATATDNGGYGASHDLSSAIIASPAITYSGNVSGTLDNDYTLGGAGPAIKFNSNGPQIKLQTTNVIGLLNSSGTELVRFDLANTRVGVGTNAPSTEIDVLRTGANATIKVRTSTSGNAQFQLDHAGASDFGIILFRQGGSEFGRIQHTNSGDLSYSATTKHTFNTAATTRLVIESGGLIDYKQAAVTAGSPFTNTAKVPVKINGVSYNLMLCA